MIILTIDVEDWFQVENFKGIIRYEDWNKFDLRVESNVSILLDLLDMQNIKATFFILGWIGKKCPKLVKKIYKRGHEIASHGYSHKLVYSQTTKEFERDVKMSKDILEDIIGTEVIGYRAPSFSITQWAIEILKDAGYIYDSSFFPTSLNKRYGKINQRIGQPENIDGIIEIPLSTINFKYLSIPWSGGAYFRLIPFLIFKKGMELILKKNGFFVFYLHPWEIDYFQPRLKNIPLSLRFRHYWGLKFTLDKFRKFLSAFHEIISVEYYLRKETLSLRRK